MDQEGTGPSETPIAPVTPPPAGVPGQILPPGVQVAIGLQAGPLPPQILEKIDGQHISQILQSQENELGRQHDAALKQLEYRNADRKSSREFDAKRDKNHKIFAGCTATGAFVFILVLTLLLLRYNQAELVKIVIPAVLSFGAGALAGIGYQRSRQ